MGLTITIREAARQVLAAHAAGTLLAQSPEAYSRYYSEQDGLVYKCAIGCLFSDQEAKLLEYSRDYLMAYGLIRSGVIETDHNDIEGFQTIQGDHDAWAASRRHGTQRDVDKAEVEFLKHVKELAQ